MKYEKDDLGTRMKDYEIGNRKYLEKDAYTIIRLDGKAFHTYTRGRKRPFDETLIENMDETAIHLCENIQGCKLAYVQSDEITLVLTAFDKDNTDQWFGGEVQKTVSVSASEATEKFNRLEDVLYLNEQADDCDTSDIFSFIEHLRTKKGAKFDARCWTIPRNNVWEVWNNLIWRQQDCIRNSVSSVAQSEFSSKELHKVNVKGMKAKLKAERNIDWNEFSESERNGRIILKAQVEKVSTYDNKIYTRNTWKSYGSKVFTEDKSQIEFLENIGK